MAERYFQKFPLVYYSNNFVVNITERAAILNSVMADPNLYYRYDISDGKRPDQIADAYYEDQYMSWILYLNNKIIDPYYQWYLPNDQMNSLLSKKYGDLNLIQKKIAFYRTNWYSEDRLTPAAYASLPPSQHRYWSANYNINKGSIISYSRSKQELTLSTNKMVSYTCNATSFANNELVNIKFDASHSGVGQVALANSTTLVLQHLSGTIIPNTSVVITGSSYIYGVESHTNSVFTAASLIVSNIPAGEETYWEPITIYESEIEKNETHKSIKILSKGYSLQAANELENLLK
jgi:hypothetical protein